MPCLKATPDTVLPNQRGVERRLRRDPEKAKVNQTEMKRLIQAGAVSKLDPTELDQGDEAWDPNQWPADLSNAGEYLPDAAELHTSTFCGATSIAANQSDLLQYNTREDLF